MPDVEVKGESAVYFLLVQGTDDVGSSTCRVRMMHSHGELNGAAAMATISSLLREKHLSSGILLFLSRKCTEMLTFSAFFISRSAPLFRHSQGTNCVPLGSIGCTDRSNNIFCKCTFLVPDRL